MNLQYRAALACLIEAQGNRCAYCWKPLPPIATVRSQHNFMRPTIDHVVPQGYGGEPGRGNWLAAHARCNTAKGGLPPTPETMEVLQAVNTILGWETPACGDRFAADVTVPDMALALAAGRAA